jgi:anti-sigma B factor antagonist
MAGPDPAAAVGGEEPLQAELECSEQDEVYSVAVSGEVDISNVGSLREAALQIPNRALGLVVDLSAATFIDSATIGLLFELRQSLGRRSQALRVVCPPGTPAERILTLMSFDGALLSGGPLDDAIAAIRREMPLRASGADAPGDA